MIIRPAFAAEHSALVCALSTRLGGVSHGKFGMNLSFAVGDDPEAVEENRRRFFGSIGIPTEALVFQKQVHGDVVRHVTMPGVLESTDGSCTSTPGIFLCVTIADCVPVFLFDPRVPAVGVVHAGWRGTAGEIARKGVEVMVRELGAQPSGMQAYIGPSAGVCCYAVGDEVVSRLPASCVHMTGGETKADLKAANRQHLLLAGLPAEGITIDPACTICGSALYHSHRRDGKESGRMMGVIGLRAPLPLG